MIRVYPSMLPGEPLETHRVENITLGDWLAKNVPDYNPDSENHPIVVHVNGVNREPCEWPGVYITDGTVVDIYVAPQSGAVDAVSSVLDKVVGVFTSLFSFLMPDVPDVSAATRGQGEKISGPSAEANAARINQIVPDVAGRHKIFPDYLNSPRRYFTAPKTQALDLLMCLGVGEYEIEQLRIGETPFSEFGDALTYEIFQPGADVTGNQAHEPWYIAPEVGNTTGGAGIKLLSTRDVEQNWDATLSLSGTTISGADQPQGWEEDLILRLFFAQPVTITREDPNDENSDNIFEADLSWLIPSNGLDLLIATSPTVGISAQITELDTNAGTFKLEPRGGGANFNSYAPGNYDWRFTRWDTGYENYRITAVNDGSFNLVLQLNGSDVGGWPGFPSGTSSVELDVDDSFSEGIWSNAFLACPRNETIKRFEWDIFAPQGLGIANDNGDVDELSRWIEMEYREAGSGNAWQLISNNIVGRTRDQLGYTFRADLPNFMTPEVRVRRVEAESNESNYFDALEWLALRSQLDFPPASYDGATVIAVQLTGGFELSKNAENKVNVIATRKLDGVATRSIADYARYVMQDIGLTADDYDDAELTRLDGIWQPRGDTFDFIHDGADTAFDVLSRIVRTGFAEMTINDGKLTPVRDELRTTFEEMYTLQNMTGDGLSRSVVPLRSDDVDGVDVEYFDSQSWTKETIECRLPGDLGIRAEKIRVEGVTDRTRAWRIGMRARSEQRYRRKTYSFGTELDALNSGYWSYCALADDVPGYTSSGLIVDAVDDAGTVTAQTSEPLDWQDNETHLFAWRDPDGVLVGPYTATRGADDYHVIFTGQPPVVDYTQELPHYMFGVNQRFSYPVLINSVQPDGFDSVSVQAVNYDDRVYDYDDMEPSE